MKVAWIVLLVSAFTDFIITAGTGVMTVLTAAVIDPAIKDSIRPVIFVAPMIGGLVAAARTVQQALKVTPETAATLKGTPTVTTTTTTPTNGEPSTSTVVKTGGG